MFGRSMELDMQGQRLGSVVGPPIGLELWVAGYLADGFADGGVS